MFEWDERKSILNREKHAVSFMEGMSVFFDPESLDGVSLRSPSTEKRRFRLGRSALYRILVVIYTFRETADGEKTIRIISARQASRKERRAYRERRN